MKRTTPIVLLGIAVIATFGLTGCLPGGGLPTPAPSATDSGAPSADPSSASPTPTAEPTKPALSDMYLSPEGYGPLVISQPPPVTSPALDVLIHNPAKCTGFTVPDGWLWEPNYPTTPWYTQPGYSGEAFSVRVEGGNLDRIQVNSDLLHTESGIHLGSTLSELLAAYPGGFTSTFNATTLSKVYILRGTHGQIWFEVATDDGSGYWTAADINHVLFINVVTLSTAPYAVTGTDGGIGACETA